MNKPTFSERFRYWFDNLMSKGVVALIGLLGLITILFVAGDGGDRRARRQ